MAAALLNCRLRSRQRLGSVREYSYSLKLPHTGAQAIGRCLRRPSQATCYGEPRSMRERALDVSDGKLPTPQADWHYACQSGNEWSVWKYVRSIHEGTSPLDTIPLRSVRLTCAASRLLFERYCHEVVCDDRHDGAGTFARFAGNSARK